jgi:hypothetical protein
MPSIPRCTCHPLSDLETELAILASRDGDRAGSFFLWIFQLSYWLVWAILLGDYWAFDVWAVIFLHAPALTALLGLVKVIYLWRLSPLNDRIPLTAS